MRSDVTRLLSEIGQGSPTAWDQLLPLVYDELRALAGSLFRRGLSSQTLQPTLVVHEAYLRLVAHSGKTPGYQHWNGRAHFFAVAATAMRQVLISYIRQRRAEKRGGECERVTLSDAASPATGNDVEIETLHEALTKLAALDERQARIVELRYFANMTTEEIAHVLSISVSTVEREWRMARAWLTGELREGERV